MLEDQNAEVDQIIEDDKEISEILERLMLIRPSFSGNQLWEKEILIIWTLYKVK